MVAGTASWIAMLLTLGLASAGGAQRESEGATEPPGSRTEYSGDVERTADSILRFENDSDSAGVREAAEEATESRLIVSLQEKILVWMDGSDTLRLAPIAVGKGSRLQHEDQVWDFSTPRGVRRVLSKEEKPVWSPPDWHYVELARDSALVLVPLPRDSGVQLLDGTRVVVRGDRIGREYADGRFELIPANEEVIFGDTLFVPPHGTANRRVEGELGAFKIDLGDGYMIHGTPHKTSIGTAATHGCIRMRDGDLEYLYYRVPLGTPVYIY